MLGHPHCLPALPDLSVSRAHPGLINFADGKRSHSLTLTTAALTRTADLRCTTGYGILLRLVSDITPCTAHVGGSDAFRYTEYGVLFHYFVVTLGILVYFDKASEMRS